MRGLSGDHDTCSQPDISSGYSANKLIDNLEGMDSYLSRLKGLAQGLNEEIVTQNEMIDRLNSKADKADFTILRQNKEMNKLLKK
jgi:peptidoglycan hydrolase CwlO-like protein